VPREDQGKVGSVTYADVALNAVQKRTGEVELEGTYQGYPVKPGYGAIYDHSREASNRDAIMLEVDVSKDYIRNSPRVIKIKGDPKLYKFDVTKHFKGGTSMTLYARILKNTSQRKTKPLVRAFFYR